MARENGYVSVSLTVEARDALQRLTAEISGAHGRVVSMSRVVVAVAGNISESDIRAIAEDLLHRSAPPPAADRTSTEKDTQR